jgi:hypothetical protein
MSKGDLIEPVLVIVTRIFFPKHSVSSVFSELSWAWLASFIFATIVYETLRRYFKVVENEQGKEVANTVKKRLRVCRYFVGIALSIIGNVPIWQTDLVKVLFRN